MRPRANVPQEEVHEVESRACGAEEANVEEADPPSPSPPVKQPPKRTASSPPSVTYQLHERYRQRLRKRASDHPALDMPLARYLAIAQWAAAQFQQAHYVAPQPEIATALEENGIVAEVWLKTLAAFERLFRNAVGAPNTFSTVLRRCGRQTLVGLRASRDVFT